MKEEKLTGKRKLRLTREMLWEWFVKKDGVRFERYKKKVKVFWDEKVETKKSTPNLPGGENVQELLHASKSECKYLDESKVVKSLNIHTSVKPDSDRLTDSEIFICVEKMLTLSKCETSFATQKYYCTIVFNYAKIYLNIPYEFIAS